MPFSGRNGVTFWRSDDAGAYRAAAELFGEEVRSRRQLFPFDPTVFPPRARGESLRDVLPPILRYWYSTGDQGNLDFRRQLSTNFCLSITPRKFRKNFRKSLPEGKSRPAEDVGVH